MKKSFDRLATLLALAAGPFVLGGSAQAINEVSQPAPVLAHVDYSRERATVAGSRAEQADRTPRPPLKWGGRSKRKRRLGASNPASHHHARYLKRAKKRRYR
jgi:hypothetical protein